MDNDLFYDDSDEIKPDATEGVNEQDNSDTLEEVVAEIVSTPDEVLPVKTDYPDPATATGLVLSGGGAKGAYQVGVLKALAEAGLLKDVSYISGDSIGAINAMLYCLGDSQFMYDVWENINMPEVFEPDPDLFSNNPKLFSRDKVTSMMNEYLKDDVIRNLPCVVYAGVTRLEGVRYFPEYMKLNGHTKNEMIDILLASSAIPIVYEAVRINGKEYLDGGLTDNEPIKPLYDLGVRRFIIIGLDSDKVFEHYKYPDAECYAIYPSHDLGDLLSGTMNYEIKAKHFREMLGEKDGKLAVKTHFEKDPTYISLRNEINRTNYLEIKNTLKVETAQRDLGASIDKHMAYFNKIYDKYKDF